MTARLRIALVAWDLVHNGANCAFFLADFLRRNHDVEVIGPTFMGTEILAPIRAAGIPIRSFPGTNLPHLVDDVDAFVSSIEADVIYASKPRLPAFLIAMALKERTGAPVLMHVDDFELGFVSASEGISLDELERRRSLPDFSNPYRRTWVQACDSLIRGADAVTVSGDELQRRYGGTLVTQARDETLFDPDLFVRENVRAQYGYGDEDRVVLFLGYPRRHKGVLEIAEAVAETDDPHIKLCIVGSFNEPLLRRQIAGLDRKRIKLVDARPVSEVPRLMTLGDLVCLPQDTATEYALYQTPMKLTEALAMGVPVLARETASLASFVDRGLIRKMTDGPLSEQITAAFAAPDELREMARRGREFFLSDLSYAAALQTVENLVDGLQRGRHELPASWLRARELAASAYPGDEPLRPSLRRECPVCGYQHSLFEPMSGGREDAVCRRCGSLERHRLLWLYLLNETDLFAGAGRRPRVLAVGAERAVEERLLGDHRLDAIATGLTASTRVMAVDLRGLPFPDGSFDVVYCHQTLDRVADDGQAMRELRRVLRRGGWGLLQSRPLGAGATEEDPELDDAAERARRFGHREAYRRYGRDFSDRLARAGFHVTVDPYGRRIGPAGCEHFGLNADEVLFLVRRPADQEPPDGPANADEAQPRPGRVEHLLGKPWAQDGARGVAGGNALLAGAVEAVRGGEVLGWAWRPASPDWRAGVRVLLDGAEVAGGIADLPHASLQRTELGDGCYGFRVPLPGALASTQPHRLRVEAEGGLALPADGEFVTAPGPGSSWQGATFLVEDAVHGRIDGVRDGAVHGWAWLPAAPDRDVVLTVLVDGHPLAQCVCDIVRPAYEPDSVQGRRGFRVELPAGLAVPGRRCIRVQTADGGALPAAATFAVEATDAAWRATCFTVDASNATDGGGIQGRVESIDGAVAGWAWRPGRPAARVWVRLVIGGRDVASGVAEEPRPMLADAGLGDGRYGFRFQPAPAAEQEPPQTVRVETEDGTTLPASAELITAMTDGLPDHHVEISPALYR
jgi:glycosyltransferase involved in cell wall biosynthesis/SAM-dependent methyltransferase